MPQMAPISWLILFIIFTLTFMMFNIMNYFTFFYKPSTLSSSKKINFQQMNWKW
nr:ATP synthase F0 subunit 8 [Coboldia fuscipes]